MSTLFDTPAPPIPAPAGPRWLAAYATTTGDHPALIGTRAVPRWCPDCGRLLLAGYDAPLLADLATVDPNPLTPQLEAAAVILDRPTWRLWGAPGRYELTDRTPQYPPFLRLPLAGTNDVVVVASHHCGHPPLTSAHLPVRTPRTAELLGDPPF